MIYEGLDDDSDFYGGDGDGKSYVATGRSTAAVMTKRRFMKVRMVTASSKVAAMVTWSSTESRDGDGEVYGSSQSPRRKGEVHGVSYGVGEGPRGLGRSRAARMGNGEVHGA